jgi:hypothetical protein
VTTTIRPQSVTALAVTSASRREYQLTDEHGCPRASLRVNWSVRRGEISTEHGTTSVRRLIRGRVKAGEDNQPGVCLSRAASIVPGPVMDASWVITRNLRAYNGTLTRGGDTMVIALPALSGCRLAIELTGDWERRDLVVLTACFALLARRRRDVAIMMAVNSSHGS